MSDLPYPPDTGRTHYEGCWQNPGHHNCAVARVRQLEAQITEMWQSFNQDRCGRERQTWAALPPSPDA